MKRSYSMVALVVLGGALFFSGLGEGALFLLWPLVCLAMMLAMMWGMRGMGRPEPHAHPDDVTHVHDEDIQRSSQ